MSPPDLLARVAAHGWAVELRDGPRLVRVRGDAPGRLPTPLVEALKKHRDAVVAWLSACGVCGADVSDDETRDRLADPLFCDRGGSQPVTDGNGDFHEGTQRCPYKP